MKFDPVYSKLLECYLTLMPLILYKPQIVAFICLQRSQVVHFVSIRTRTFVMISLQAERNVKVLVLDKISRKMTCVETGSKMTKGGTAKRGRRGKFFVNWDFQASRTVNTWKISGMLIVWWPITIMFRTPEQTSKPQTNYRCCLQFGCLMPYWLFPRNTITFHKYFWCLRFCEFHSNLRQESNNKNRQLGTQAYREGEITEYQPALLF